MAASEATQRCWAIAEKLGQPVPPHMKIYEAICDELMAQPVERYVALAIANYVAKWKQQGNPFYIDAAFIVLAKAGGTPTETMLQEDNAARIARYNGAPAGTADAIKSEDAEWAALILMANLIFHGRTQREASRIAASYYALKNPTLKRKKASVLERYYSRKVRKEGLEDRMFDSWERNSELHWASQWDEFARAIPECPEHLIGNARD